MATLPETVARSLVEKRLESFTRAPITITGDGTRIFNPAIQQYLNTSADTPAGIQPVSGWTVANVRKTYGYVQLTSEMMEGSNVGLTTGLSAGGVYHAPEVIRLIARFAIVSPVGTTDDYVEETARLIRVLYERVALVDTSHADWPLLVVSNRPLGGSGSPWRLVLERDEVNGWRNDRITGEFETSPVLRPYASSDGSRIDIAI